MSSKNNLRFLTLNVRGLNNVEKRTKVFQWLINAKSDITFLQETYCTEKALTAFKASWTGINEHAVTDSAHSRGVSILFNPKHKVTIENKHASIDGRLLLLNIELNGKFMTLVNVYANNAEKQRKDLFKKLEKWITLYARYKDNLVIAGDMNACLREQDRSNTNAIHLNEKSVAVLRNVINKCNLKDAWGSITDDPGFTFEDKQYKTHSRLDYIFVNKQVKLDTNDVYVTVCPCGPDHSAVVVELRVNCNERGKSYWKMNNELLENEEFNTNVKMIVCDIKSKYKEKTSAFIWELVKIRIKEMAIRLSILISRKGKQDREAMQKELDEINANQVVTNQNNVLLLRKQELESALNESYSKEAKGAQLRSKANYVEKGEKSTRYFKDLEKIHQVNNVIEGLQVENGDIVHTNVSILDECCKFYKNLYTSQRIDPELIDDYVRNTDMPRLSNEEKEMCDSDITENEVYEAIVRLKHNKSPGIDGLTPEFYKKHWVTLKEPFMDMLKESYENNKLPDTLNQSVITLIFKKGDRTLLKNYRPLSLSNYDYKIIAFVLAKRLQQVIKTVINTDQSAYIRGRYIGMNARFISDFFEYCERYNTDGIILSLDFEKAFDRLEWNYMTKALKAFNIGHNFINWIGILYRHPKIIIKNNGWLSVPIETERGIRQGCPVSALLFIIATELMAINIRANRDIKGIQLGTTERKLAQYADDSTLTLTSIDSINASMKTINDYCNVSGMKLNIAKTEGIWLGSLKGNPNLFHGIHFTKNPVRILGIYIGHDKDKCYDENWVRKINKLKNCIHVWKSRKLTLFGKVHILKSLAMSKFIYSMSVLYTPKEIIKEITKCFYSFLWNKVDRIKRNTLISKYEQGGIKMIDVESMAASLKAAWIPRLINLKDNECMLFEYLHKYGLNIYVLINGNVSDEKIFPDNIWIPKFYMECVTSFNMCKGRNKCIDVHDFLTQPIWCNNQFFINKHTICFMNWIKSGFLFVKDLYDENGTFVSGQYVFQRLKSKSNWICEYRLVKKAIERIGHNYNDKYYAPFEHVNNNHLLIHGKLKSYVILDQRSKFFYELLMEKKCVRPYMEKWWVKHFSKDIDMYKWENIYINRVQGLPDSKLKDFMYKLLHNLLPCRETLFKWKKEKKQCMPDM